MNSWCRGLLVVGSIAGLVGCASSTGAPTAAVNGTTPGPGASTPTTGGSGLSSGSASSTGTGETDVMLRLTVPAPEAAAIAVAMDRSMASCMQERGFQYVPIDLAVATAMASADDYDDIAAWPIDPAVESAGYRLPAVDDDAPFDNDAYARSLEPAQMQAWSDAALGDFDETVSVSTPDGESFEVPVDGCLSESRVATFGSIENAIMYEVGLSTIELEAASRTRSDPSVVDALSAWSTCMKESTGYNFTDFSEARALVRGDASKNGVIAPADAECTTKTGLDKTYRDVNARKLDEVIDANLGRLEAFDAELAKIIANATSGA